MLQALSEDSKIDSFGREFVDGHTNEILATYFIGS